MPIDISQIAVGTYFVTPGPKPQLRKVTGTHLDTQGRIRVNYLAKSAQIPRRAFAPAATRANPALATTFATACDRALSQKDVAALRKANILLVGE